MKHLIVTKEEHHEALRVFKSVLKYGEDKKLHYVSEIDGAYVEYYDPSPNRKLEYGATAELPNTQLVEV